jgi:hypothetical protein
MRMGEHVEHALDRQCILGMNAGDPALGDGGRDHDPVREIGDVVLGRKFRDAGHLGAAFDPRRGLSEMIEAGHGAFLT